MSARRLNLPAIERSLRLVQQEFTLINDGLSSPRELLADDVIANMLSGYALVDALVAANVDVFAMGNLKYLLELNATVLCGTDPESRAEYARHRQTTEERFYDQRDGGIQDLVEWYELHLQDSAWMRAAGVYVRLLGRPQLFVEGNHRTGALAMSYILVREQEPPFVLSPANAPAYFDPGLVTRDTEKQGLAMLFRSPGVIKRLAGFLVEHADPAYLLPV